MSRKCTRFRADWQPCPNSTNRADGWCGHCDGFGAASVTPLRPDDDVTKMGRWFSRREGWTDAKPPIESDEIQDISVGRRGIEWYANHHGVSTAEAETQIRSLLEDCLLNGRTMRNARGFWRLEIQGYGVALDPACDKVLSYHTRHRERTWAQVKAGVKSRVTLENDVAQEIRLYLAEERKET